MPFNTTDIPGLQVFEPNVFEDERGYFFESYNEKLFQEAGVAVHWVQDNQSSSGYGVIRGLHYQLPPHDQSKLLRVLRGIIFDVVVDIRIGSPTFGKAYCTELSEENKRQLFIPKGMAHGFSVLSEKADVLYKCDAFYNKQSEAGIVYNDPDLNIDWRVPDKAMVISEKDRQLPQLKDCQNSFIYQ